LYEQKDFLAIAKELTLTDQARVRFEFYSALNTLSEVGQIRAFLQKNKATLTKTQLRILTEVYVNNLTYEQTANILNCSKQSIQQTIKRVLDKYHVKFQIFVKKENNKTIYNIPRLLK
jgi:predicted DNA-binding protein YlxM (UPF0122 family)